MDRATDGLMRVAAFTWLGDLRSTYGDIVPFAELRKGFWFRNGQVRVLGPQGIFIPQGGTVPLSITTAPPKSGKLVPTTTRSATITCCSTSIGEPMSIIGRM